MNASDLPVALKTKPILGQDLDTLREMMGMTASEACWFYGISMNKWTDVVRKEAKSPVGSITLSLLVRALSRWPELSPLPPSPGAQEIYERLKLVDEGLEKKKFSVYFGCEASAGYRWITKNSELSPALRRLFGVFAQLFDRTLEQGGLTAATEMLGKWRRHVTTEAEERGISDVFRTGKWVKAPGAMERQPVRGQDLDSLREQIGLTIMDACWLFGLSISKWTEVAKGEKAKKPLANTTLALLVRLLQDHPELCPLRAPPSAKDVFTELSQIESVDNKKLGVYFGREASAGYRWLTAGSRIGAILTRLFTVMVTGLERRSRPEEKHQFLQEWRAMVMQEAQCRGVPEVFDTGRWTQGVSPSRMRDPSKPKRPMPESTAQALRASREARAAARAARLRGEVVAQTVSDIKPAIAAPVRRKPGRPRKDAQMGAPAVTPISDLVATPQSTKTGSVTKRTSTKSPAKTPLEALIQSSAAPRKRTSAKAKQSS